MISNLTVHELSKTTVVVQQQTYVNATSICKALNKRWPDYYRLNSTKAHISLIAEGLALPKSKLVITTEGGNPNNQGTWIHPSLVPDLTRWCNLPPSEQREKLVQANLASLIPGAKREVICPAGKIDILSSKEIIEVKRAEQWCTAVGQLLIFGLDYPEHTKRLHIFGELSQELAKLIEDRCNKFNILVTYEMP